jgi:hypothetical protein
MTAFLICVRKPIRNLKNNRGETIMENIKEKIARLEDYIMKNCLWQFNSRAWDRKNQNDNIKKSNGIVMRGTGRTGNSCRPVLLGGCRKFNRSLPALFSLANLHEQSGY